MLRSKPAIPVILLALAALALYCDPTRSAPATAGPIPLKELRDRGVAGELGERLGKIVTVRGTVVAGNSLDFKDAQGRTYLKATRVGDRDLKEPVLIEVRMHSQKRDLKLPAEKAPAVLTGWETGEYDGFVDHEFDYLDRGYAAPGYHFRTWFVVVKFGAEAK